MLLKSVSKTESNLDLLLNAKKFLITKYLMYFEKNHREILFLPVTDCDVNLMSYLLIVDIINHMIP